MNSPLAPSSPASPLEIKTWLEWAGSKLLAMPIRSPKPKENGTYWPDFPRDAMEAFGYSNVRLRPPPPDKDEITFVDEILLLPILIIDTKTRRIVQSRSLVAPISQRHLYSYARIAKMLGSDRGKVFYLYKKGLNEIANKAPEKKVQAFRQFLPSS